MIDSHSVPYDAVFHIRISVSPGLVSLISKFSYVYHGFLFFYLKSCLILCCQVILAGTDLLPRP